MTVSGLTAKGDTATATYTVKNQRDPMIRYAALMSFIGILKGRFQTIGPLNS